MTFFLNIGYGFKAPGTVTPDGSIVLACSMPMHQLERRRIGKKYPHMQRRIFDPQLYLAGLDAATSPKHCANLASYPWLGVDGLGTYDSSEQTQKNWKATALDSVAKHWTGHPPTDPEQIVASVAACIDFQERLGCWGILLPGPLTIDPSTDYAAEVQWIDAGLDHLRDAGVEHGPVFATVALADICLRYADPKDNNLLDLILDAVSAREVDGVYLVVEQGSEPGEARQCGSTRVLRSMLHLTHLFSSDAKLKVGVNFVGPFGLACVAAGAEWWASGWYKSLYRLRLADKLAGGRAFPLYWSHALAADINLDSDFDALAKAQVLHRIADQTAASDGLLSAAARGVRTSQIPAWRYAQSNVRAAAEHFLLSVVARDAELVKVKPDKRRDLTQKWLADAVGHAKSVRSALGEAIKTRLDHVQAWHSAFTAYRSDHKV